MSQSIFFLSFSTKDRSNDLIAAESYKHTWFQTNRVPFCPLTLPEYF